MDFPTLTKNNSSPLAYKEIVINNPSWLKDILKYLSSYRKYGKSGKTQTRS